MQLYCFFINATALSARLKRLHFRKEVEKIYSTVTGLAPLGKQNTHLIASHLRRVFAREIGLASLFRHPHGMRRGIAFF